MEILIAWLILIIVGLIMYRAGYSFGYMAGRLDEVERQMEAEENESKERKRVPPSGP